MRCGPPGSNRCGAGRSRITLLSPKTKPTFAVLTPASPRMEVVVSAEDNAEVRRISVTNLSTRTREIELTSYAEVVLNTPNADAAHQAFSNLFVETEFFAGENAILAHRRLRSSEDKPIWGVHVVVAEGELVGAVQYETDRGRFLGRGRTPSNPIAVMEDRPLSNTTGAVLDPVFSLRRRVRIPPNQTVRFAFSTAVRTRAKRRWRSLTSITIQTFSNASCAWRGPKRSRDESPHRSTRKSASLPTTRSAHCLFRSFITPAAARARAEHKAQSSLWAYGISGDLPIVVVRISKADDLRTVRKLVRGHEYLHFKGLNIDLVILNDSPTSYLQLLHQELDTIVRTSGLGLQDKPGGVYLRQADQMPEADRILLHAVARCDRCRARIVRDQIERPRVQEPLPLLLPRLPSQTYPELTLPPPDLTFFNGLGGFHQGGREYVTFLGAEQWTPAPWSNIIGNSVEFGFQITETGGGCTWSLNSRENRLTPWSNDAVSDPPGEVVYLRDEDTGTVWSATPLPIREREPYIIRHGQGYSVFEHTSHGISQELLVFAPLDAPVKVSLLRLRNRTGRKRRLSVTNYNELVLGVSRSSSALHHHRDRSRRVHDLREEPFNNEFAERVAFVASSEGFSSATCDRKEFIGRNSSPETPAALRRTGLAGRDGAGLDPCAAIQTTIELAPNEAREVSSCSARRSRRLRRKLSSPTSGSQER